MTLQYYCDRCGVELRITQVHILSFDGLILEAGKSNEDRHLCGDCRDRLEEWLGDPS